MSLFSWTRTNNDGLDNGSTTSGTSAQNASTSVRKTSGHIRHDDSTVMTRMGEEQRDGGGIVHYYQDALTKARKLVGASDTAAKRRDLDMDEEENHRPPYIHCMIAGGIGGSSGDMLMHSLDTVKTRQQGDPHIPPKYTSMSSSYITILRQEGIRRGLYSGVTPALLGSFPGTVIFFGSYEWTKRHMIDAGIAPSLSYLASGFLADLAASIVYVPSEVLKTRLQLQGRYNNPHFNSGYNYRSTADAFRTIVRQEGFAAMFSGYKATIFRDLPFSALQFAFYEQERKWAKDWAGRRDIGLSLEVLTATTAGGMAGVLTCPLDVVKTRIQTQRNPQSSTPHPRPGEGGLGKDGTRHSSTTQPTSKPSSLKSHARPISTSSPSTSTVKPGAPILDTSSVITGLRLIYKTEGIVGWFRGVGPRAVWTSVQSGTMLVLYQFLLKQLESWQEYEGAQSY